MADASIETLEKRSLFSTSAAPMVFLGFPKAVTLAKVGEPVPPIVVWAQNEKAHIVKSFNEPVTFELGDGSTRSGRFREGVAILRGLRLTTAVNWAIGASAAGAMSDDVGLLQVNPGQAVSFQITQSTFYRSYLPDTSPVIEYVQLMAFDRYGNATQVEDMTVRTGNTTMSGVNAEIQGTDSFGGEFHGVIFRHGRAVAVPCAEVTEVRINFTTSSASVAEATSVELLFSNRRIKPLWTPLYQPVV